MHLLPLDRRTIFSRNVFCGATSPLLPPAMVILPAAPGLGGVPARLLTAAGSWARGPHAIPPRSAPCAPRGPGRSGAAAPSGCHPRALFAPPSLLPASQCSRAGLALRSRLRVGGGSSRAWAGGAPYRARAPRRPAGDGAGGSRSSREAAGGRGPRLGRQRHPLGTAGKRVRDAPRAGRRGGHREPRSWWIHPQQGHHESWRSKRM